MDQTDTRHLPMMPIREVVLFPFMTAPFVVGRRASVQALEEAIAGERKMFLATQHDATVNDPKPGEVFGVGTIVNIVQSLKLPDGNIKVLVEGVERAQVVSVSGEGGFFRATVRTSTRRVEPGPALDALVSRVTGRFARYVKLLQPRHYEQMLQAVRQDDPGMLADTIGANLPLTLEEKQELLEIFDPGDRLTRVADILSMEIGKLSSMMDGTLDLLRHTVATLAYRGSKAVRGAPAEFAEYRSAPDSRTPAEILAHMGDLFDWALGMCDGRHEWHNSPALPWEQGMARFFTALERLDRRLSSGVPLGSPADRIFQGPRMSGKSLTFEI
jgi:Lon protease-like protein